MNATIPGVEQNIQDLKKYLETRIDQTKTAEIISESEIQKAVIKEINLRAYKANNIILYNVPDNNDKKADNKTLVELFHDTPIKINDAVINRIGVYKNNVRPIKIRFTDLEQVNWILLNNKNISKKSKELGISMPNNPSTNQEILFNVVRDRTKNELLEHIKIKGELKI